MTRSSLVVFSVLAFSVACGVEGKQDIKSADQWLAEQEQEGAKQMAEEDKHSSAHGDPGEATEEEKKREWDEKQADLELKRAARSAETCPESVTEKAPKGRASVTLVFTNDGRVKESTISSEYADNAVGKCVLRAMGSIIVPAYTGGEHTVEWEVDLTGKKQSGPKGGDKKEE
jgi:hypothetical protein